MIEQIYIFLLILDQTGAFYVLMILGMIRIFFYANGAQNEVIRLRKVLKQVMR